MIIKFKNQIFIEKLKKQFLNKVIYIFIIFLEKSHSVINTRKTEIFVNLI